MIRSIAHVSKLLLTAGKSRSTTQVFVSDISESDEKKLGKLFGILEIDSRERENAPIIASLVEAAEEFYYGPKEKGTERASGKDRLSQLSLNDMENIEGRLEKTLQKLNLKATELIRNEEINLLPEKINAVIGVMKDRSLFFTHLGRVQAYLIHKKKNGDYTMVNILERSGDAPHSINLIRIFSNIVSGAIGAEDVVFFSTASLFDYFSLEHLKNTLTSLTLPSALHQFKTRLQDSGSSLNFGALFMKLVTQREYHLALTQEGVAPSFSQESMAELSRTHEKTREYLTPSVFKSFSKHIQNASHTLRIEAEKASNRTKEWWKNRQAEQTVKKEARAAALRAEQMRIAEMPKIKKGPALRRQAAVMEAAPKHTKQEILAEVFTPLPEHEKTVFRKRHAPKLIVFMNFLKAVPPAIREFSTRSRAKIGPYITKERLTLLARRIAAAAARIFHMLKNRFLLLPKTSKILLAAALIMVALFFGNLFRARQAQTNEIEIAAWNTQVEDIRKKINAAEASVIYNDETKGRALLTEAQNLLGAIKTENESREETKRHLTNEVNTLLQKMQHMEYIADPVSLFDVSTLGQNIKTGGLVLFNNTLVTWDKETNTLYKINSVNNAYEAETIKGHSAEFGRLEKGIVKNDRSILFLEGGNRLFELDVQNAVFQEKTLPLQSPSTRLADIFLFNNRLYTLANDGAILRHDGALSGYGRGSAWVKDGTDTRGAVSLAVDGTAYLLRDGGEILKFIGGKKQNFKVGAIDPPLSAPTKIFTSTKHEYLYILEPSHSRLVVLDKTGKMIIQYSSDAFRDLKDFAVSDDEKKLYLLSGNSIYGILINLTK